MFYTKPLIIQRKLDELREARYDLYMELADWQTRTGHYTGEGIHSDIDPEWTSFCVGDTWLPAFHLTRWIRRTVEIPRELAGRKVHLVLKTGGEGIVRVDGKIATGLSSYSFGSKMERSRVLLSEKAVSGDTFEVEVEASLNYGEANLKRMEGITQLLYTFEQAALVAVNEDVEGAWFDLNTAFEAMQTLKNPIANLTNSALMLDGEVEGAIEAISRDTYVYDKVVDAVVSAANEFDFDMGREALLATVPKARAVLADKLAAIDAHGHALIRFVGQAHIDTAWLWTIRETIRKVGRTFANVLALMDEYPEFVFAFSQPQLFEFAKQHYPELYAKIKQRVAEGRIELVGNAWVEMDVNVPSGEALVRQLLYGRAFYLAEFGKASDVYFMPDVFGYTWALPQIIARSGNKYFFTSKIVHNDTNRFPHSLFNWQGVDGTRVLAYMQRLNYNGLYTPKTVNTLYKRFDEKHISENLLMTFGFGDGGGGPVYEMLESGRRLGDFPGLQKTESGTAQAFFEANEGIKEKLPLWNDEMFFELHRGTQTTQANTKKNNRESELLYRRAEIAASMAMLGGQFGSPNAELLPGYKRLLTNQFHDILPGSSIAPVYEEAERDYMSIRAIGEGVLTKAQATVLRGVEHQKGDVAVFNYLSWAHRGLVYVEGDLEIKAMKNRATGETALCIRAERNGADCLCFEAVVPPMGVAIYAPCAGADGGSGIARSAKRLENEYLVVTLGDNGDVISVYDKQVGRETLAAPSNRLRLYEDKPAENHAWDIDLEYRNKSWDAQLASDPEVVVNTSVMGAIRVIKRFHKSTITQLIRLAKGTKRVDFETRVHWHEREKMLKAEFTPDVLVGGATYEIQFGAIKRSSYDNTSQERAKFEVCGHKWADMSESNYGVALLNNCKYGYDARENRLGLTLLRAPIAPDPSADVGEHTFTYALLPHTGSWQAAGVVNAGYELNAPLEAVICADSAATDAAQLSMLAVDAPNVIIDAVKAAEDGRGLIIRTYEATGGRTTANLVFGFPVKGVRECNLMEDDERKLPLDEHGLTFAIKPFEIKTFRLLY